MRQVDRPILVSCLKHPCQWQNEKAVKRCPYLEKPDRGEQGFPRGVCRLYSTPGPHAESSIALTLGVSVSVIRREHERAMEKLQLRLLGDMSLSHSLDYMQMIEKHFGR